MATRITRIGNTLTVEIPEELVSQSALSLDRPVEWVPNAEGGLSLVPQSSPAKSRQAHPSLAELLDALPETEASPEYDWGTPVGREAW